jgi:hypothetical protein
MLLLFGMTLLRKWNIIWWAERDYLSNGGRLISIKKTLSNMPTFYLSLFPIWVGVTNRL